MGVPSRANLAAVEKKGSLRISDGRVCLLLQLLRGSPLYASYTRLIAVESDPSLAMLPASIASSFVGEARPSLLRTHRKLLTVAVGLLFFLFTSSYHYHHRQAAPDLPRPTYHSSYTSSAALLARPPATLPRAVLGDDGTNFTTFLDAHFPLDTPLPHIWLTLAEGSWVSQGTLALQSFVDQLNRERVLLGRKETALVTLCMDEECVKFAARNGMYAFGGFQFNRPEKAS